MSDAVLAVNAGSSSLKFALFELHGEGEPRVAFRDQVDGVPEAADLHALLARADAHLGADRLLAAGHRVVHGGTAFVAPVRVDDGVLKALDALTPLAPLHQPHNLAPIRALAAARPGLAQVACFDTAFHATMPDESSRLALPRAISDSGVWRYGFHGLSYEYIASHLRAVAPTLACGRVLVAHLGNGAS
ncbi:MAG: acetate/propionate family kinase, partial [Acetobacteraceae bacterium]